MDEKTTLEDTGERMVPGFHKGTVLYAEHLSRYLSAKELVADKVVLDIACGSGYGTQLLSKSAQKIYGVDIDKSTIQYANENFGGPNIEYKVGGGEEIPLSDNSIDVVISFETIEHIKDYKKFIKEIKRVLKPDGLAVVSTPNAKEFTQGNHFHLHEFEYEELLDLLKADFTYIDPYFQATLVSVIVGTEEIISKQEKFELPTYNFTPLDKSKYLYFYLLCSNREISEKVIPINALGGHYSARELTEIQELNNKNISDYKKVLKNAQKENVYLGTELAKAHKEIHRLNIGLQEILASSGYKYGQKVVRVKDKLTRNGRKKN